MKKQQPATQITNDKLRLKSETLRKMAESLDDDQLNRVVGGLVALSTRSHPQGC